MSSNEKVVIGITGMPASGKSTAANYLKARSYPVVVMGDFIRNEAKLRGMEPTAEGLGTLMIQLRKEKGPQVVAQWTIEEIKKLNSPVVVVDGVRSPEEVWAFRRAFPRFWLLSLDTPHQVRFRRALERERSDDAGGIEAFIERERNEITVGTQLAMSLANRTIEAKTCEELEQKVGEFLEVVLRESSASGQGKDLPHGEQREG